MTAVQDFAAALVNRHNCERVRAVMGIMGRPRAVLAALAGALLLAGCGTGPSQVGAAVLYDGHEVSQDEVQSLIDKAVREQPAAQQLAQQHKLDQLGRGIVTQLVVHELVRKAAQREHLVANENAVQSLLAQAQLDTPVGAQSTDPSQLAGQIAYRVRDHREAVTDQVLLEQLGERYFANLSVVFDYTTVSADTGGAQPKSMREQAFEKAQKMAETPESAAQVLRADQANQVETGVGEPVPAAQAPALAATVLFGVQPGTVVAFQPSQEQTGWVVAVVRKRDLTTTQAIDQQSAPTESQLLDVGYRLLQPYGDAGGLKVNPRYGVWDPAAMDVAPSVAETTGLVLTVKGSAQP